MLVSFAPAPHDIDHDAIAVEPAASHVFVTRHGHLRSRISAAAA